MEITQEDNDTLKNFIELIEYSNGKILDLHNERAVKDMSSEDSEMVMSIIGEDLDNDFVDVE